MCQQKSANYFIPLNWQSKWSSANPVGGCKCNEVNTWFSFCFHIEIVVQSEKFAVFCRRTPLIPLKRGDRVCTLCSENQNKILLEIAKWICCFECELFIPFSASMSVKSRSEFFKDRTPGIFVSPSLPSTGDSFSCGSVFMLSLAASVFTIESHSGALFCIVVARSPHRQLIVSSHQFSKSSARITTLSEMARISSCKQVCRTSKKN